MLNFCTTVPSTGYEKDNGTVVVFTAGSSEETGALDCGAWLLGDVLGGADGVEDVVPGELLPGTSNTPLTASFAG